MQAEQVELPAVDAVDLNRQQIAQSGQVPPALALLFSMAEGTAKRLAAPANTGWFVVALNDIVTPELEEGDPLIAATANQLESVLSDEYVEQFLAAVQAEVGIERNDEAIEAVVAQLTGRAN
jgi:peptidyl-prolyl cis-trans isomerase D